MAAEIDQSTESRLTELIVNHKQEANPHQQYLLELEAQSTYSTPDDVASAIEIHLAVENPRNITLE